MSETEPEPTLDQAERAARVRLAKERAAILRDLWPGPFPSLAVRRLVEAVEKL